jgi:hypothetical protein
VIRPWTISQASDSFVEHLLLNPPVAANEKISQQIHHSPIEPLKDILENQPKLYPRKIPHSNPIGNKDWKNKKAT